MAKTKSFPEAQSPIILRASRLIEAFAKSDDERDFYLDRVEGFILYVDLDKPQDALEALEEEITAHEERYCMIPKLSFYETKKIMESFVNEKVYDIDTKEKLIDIIDSKDARENFLEFIYDQHSELEKWQQFYQERSRIRIIEWLRNNEFQFVFEEDLEINVKTIEKLKENMFESKVGKDVTSARKTLISKAKTYYSSEALNPRPKRGRPPKQQAKQEVEQTVSADIYITVPPAARQYLFTPDISGVSAATFSAKYETEEELLKDRGLVSRQHEDDQLGDLNKKLASLRSLSSRWMAEEAQDNQEIPSKEEARPQSIQKEASKLTKTPKKAIKSKEAASPKPKASPDASSKKPLRSIMKKPSESKKEQSKKMASKDVKKVPARKRIIPKESEKTPVKKPLRKIIPKK
ncbi:MAG: UPF0158 family protein [Chlamydiota bacterium]